MFASCSGVCRSVCWLSQSMSGRLKSPTITTLGVFLCDLYSFVRDA